jgi:hypothetical protein
VTRFTPEIPAEMHARSFCKERTLSVTRFTPEIPAEMHARSFCTGRSGRSRQHSVKPSEGFSALNRYAEDPQVSSTSLDFTPFLKTGLPCTIPITDLYTAIRAYLNAGYLLNENAGRPKGTNAPSLTINRHGYSQCHQETIVHARDAVDRRLTHLAREILNASPRSGVHFHEGGQSGMLRLGLSEYRPSVMIHNNDPEDARHRIPEDDNADACDKARHDAAADSRISPYVACDESHETTGRSLSPMDHVPTDCSAAPARSFLSAPLH